MWTPEFSNLKTKSGYRQSSGGLSGLTSLGDQGGPLLGGGDGDRLRGSENERNYKARDAQCFQVGLVILIKGL